MMKYQNDANTFMAIQKILDKNSIEPQPLKSACLIRYPYAYKKHIRSHFIPNFVNKKGIPILGFSFLVLAENFWRKRD